MKRKTNSVYRDVRSGTNILDRNQFKDIVMAISDVATEMVIKTLGPGGASTIIDDGINISATKDGLHSLENLTFNDPVYNTIYRVLRSSSFNNSHTSGDGTTTAMVVSNEFMHSLDNYMDSGLLKNLTQRDLMNMIRYVASRITEKLKVTEDLITIDKSPDAKYNDIYDVAYIASNGDAALSSMIQDIYQKTGNPNIYITNGVGNEVTYNIISGYRFNCRPLALTDFANTPEGEFHEVDTTIHTYLFDHVVTYAEHRYIISSIINMWLNRSAVVIIFAPHFDDIIVSLVTNANNNRRQNKKGGYVILAQIPVGTNLERATLEDLGILLNCDIFNYPRASIFRSMIAAKMNEEEKEKFEDEIIDSTDYHYGNEMDIIAGCTGTIRSIIMKKDSVILRDYDKIADPQIYSNHMQMAKKKYDEVTERAKLSGSTTAPEYMTNRERYNRLLGNVGVIEIGAVTSLDREFMRDTVEDAVFACKSAYQNGIIRGLNITTLRVINSVKEEISPSSDEYDAYSMIVESFYQAFFHASEYVCYNMDITEENPGSFYIEDEKADVNMTPSEMLLYCIDNGMTPDLRTMMISKKMKICNPVETDLEIITSVVSIIGNLMTSTQLLTKNRQFDRGMTRAIAQEQELEMIRETKQAEMEGYLRALENVDNKNILINIIDSKTLNQENNNVE